MADEILEEAKEAFGSSEGSRRKDSLIGSALTGQGAKDAAD